MVLTHKNLVKLRVDKGSTFLIFYLFLNFLVILTSPCSFKTECSYPFFLVVEYIFLGEGLSYIIISRLRREGEFHRDVENFHLV